MKHQEFHSFVAILAGTALSISTLAQTTPTGTKTPSQPTKALVGQPTSRPDSVTPAHDAWCKNPALEFWRIWETSSSLHGSVVSKQDVADPNWKPDDEMSARLLEGQDAIVHIMLASKCEPANWGVRLDEGPAALLPHLGKIRSSARVLRVDARRLEVAGDPVGAMERVGAMIRLHKHVLTDGVLISSLVAAAVVNSGLDEATAILKANPGNEQLRSLALEAINELAPVDPFGIRQSIENERKTFLGWMRKTIERPDWKTELESLFVLENGGPASPEWKLVSAMDLPALRNQLDQAEGSYDRMLEAWDKPNAIEELDKAAEEIKSGKFGVLATILVPALGKAHAQSQAADARIAEFRELLKSQPTPKPASK